MKRASLFLTSASIVLLAGACTQTNRVETTNTTTTTDTVYTPPPVSTNPPPAPLPTPIAGGLGAPPNPRPGECYAQVTIPEQTRTESQQVVVTPASQEVRIVPAQYGTVTETVVVEEASEELITVPAIYKTVSEQVIVRPEARKLIPIEPVYETVTEQELVRPARTVWKKGRGPIERVNNITGEILCLVEEPAEYKTVKKRVLVTPGGSRTEIIPAVTRTVERRVVAQPARVEKRIIPAKTKEITKRVITVPAREEVIPIPAVMKTVDKQVVVAPPRVEWRSILCETNTTPDIIRRLQRALRDRGYNPGPIDGVFGRQTQAAVYAYQRSIGQQSTGVTIETLRSLGVM